MYYVRVRSFKFFESFIYSFQREDEDGDRRIKRRGGSPLVVPEGRSSGMRIRSFKHLYKGVF